MAGISLVQKTGPTTGVASANATYASNNTAGNTLIAIFIANPSTTSATIVDTAGNTWSPVVSGTKDAGNYQGAVFYCLNCKAAAGNQVTVTAGGTFISLSLFEYSGVKGFDKVGGGVANSTSVGATLNLVAGSELVIGISSRGAGGVSATMSSGYAIETGTNGAVQTFDGIIAAFGNTTPTITWGGSANAIGISAFAFRPLQNIVCDGDSLTVGQGAQSPYTSNLSLNIPATIHNVAVAGRTLATCLADAPTTVDPLFTTGLSNICIIWAGTNDFALSGSTVASVYSNLTSYIAARQAAGWQVYVITMISRTGNNPVGGETLDSDKNSYNTLIRANSGGANGIADIASNSELGADGAFANTTFFNVDGVHPTTTSVVTIEGPIVSDALNGNIFTYFTIAQKSATNSTSASSSVVKAFASNNTVGNLLVAFVDSTTVSTPTISDTQGNTWQGPITAPAANTSFASIFYCLSCKGGANTVTVSNGGTFTGLGLIEYSSTNGALFDTSATGAASTGTQEVNLNVSNILNGLAVAVLVQPQGGQLVNPSTNCVVEIGSSTPIQDIDALTLGVTPFTIGGTSGAQPWGMAAAAFKPAVFSITGSTGVAGTLISYSGPSSGAVVADGSGNFSILTLTNGTYTITPSLSGFVFTPTSRIAVINNANVPNINFIGALGIYSQPDCRVAPFGPNSSRTVQGTKIYDVQISDNASVPGKDSRSSVPADSRVSPNIPQNSRAPGTFGPGE